MTERPPGLGDRVIARSREPIDGLLIPALLAVLVGSAGARVWSSSSGSLLLPAADRHVRVLAARAKARRLSAYTNAFWQTRSSGRTFSFSIGMGMLTIVASSVLIAPTAYWVRLRLPQLRPVVEFITLMPFVIPPIVLVFGLIRVYSGGRCP